jgi:tRNA pseudouridine38-40 synthase
LRVAGFNQKAATKHTRSQGHQAHRRIRWDELHGWQIQPSGETIQSVLERAVSTFLRKPTRVTGSGRTDAGVHALGQVVNFHSGKDFDPYRIQRALNALTPDDITIKEVEIVADSFDARRDGRARVYEYRILNRSTPSPFHLNRAWRLHEPLDLQAMREAIHCLLGEHDFSSFRAAGAPRTCQNNLPRLARS